VSDDLRYLYAIASARSSAAIAASQLRASKAGGSRRSSRDPLPGRHSVVPDSDYEEGPLNERLQNLEWLAPRAALHQDVNAKLLELAGTVLHRRRSLGAAPERGPAPVQIVRARPEERADPLRPAVDRAEREREHRAGKLEQLRVHVLVQRRPRREPLQILQSLVQRTLLVVGIGDDAGGGQERSLDDRLDPPAFDATKLARRDGRGRSARSRSRRDSAGRRSLELLRDLDHQPSAPHPPRAPAPRRSHAPLRAVLADLAEPRDERGFALRVLLVGDPALLERELQLQKLLAHRCVIGELLLGELDGFLEAVTDARRGCSHRKREQAEEDHRAARPRPSARAADGW